MEKTIDILIRAKDQQIYPLNENIRKYSETINKSLIDLEVNKADSLGPINLNLTPKQLMLLSQYFIARNYEIPKDFTVRKPLKTSNISELLLEKDYEIFKNWSKEDINELLQASLYLQIHSLNEILLVIIASKFVFEMEDDVDIKFRKKFGIQEEEISETTANLIKNEFKWAFP